MGGFTEWVAVSISILFGFCRAWWDKLNKIIQAGSLKRSIFTFDIFNVLRAAIIANAGDMWSFVLAKTKFDASIILTPGNNSENLVIE